MAPKATLAARSNSVPLRPRPFKPYPIPMSPLRALCLHIAYKQHSPTTSYMPWLCLKELGLAIGDEVIDSNVIGFIQGQKLQPHKLRTMPFQDENVFPECMGMNRAVNDEKMYPQHGDLRSATFKRSRLAGQGVLRKQRTELVKKGKYGGIKVLEVEEIMTAILKEIQAEASMDRDLVERMKQQLREIEARKKAVREAKRGEKKTTA